MNKCVSFSDVDTLELSEISGGECYKVFSLAKWGIDFEFYAGDCPLK